MVRSVRLRLEDMAEALRDIRAIAADLDLASYRQDRVRRRAIERLVEIVSEASRHLTQEMRAATPDIPWRAVADIGNHLRHGYARVADEIMWDLVCKDLAPLAQAVETLLQQTPDEGGG